MRILNDKDEQITQSQISELKGAPVPAAILERERERQLLQPLFERERKRQLLQPLFDRLKKLGISGELQARTWCEGALAHPLAKMADIKDEEIPALVDVAKKALGEPFGATEETPATLVVPDTTLDLTKSVNSPPSTPFLDAVKECLSESPEVEEKRMCETNGCANEPGDSGFCEECSRTLHFQATTRLIEDSPDGYTDVSEELEENTAGIAPMVPAEPRQSLEVAISSHASITTGRLGPYIIRLRSWNLRKLSPERRKRFRGVVTDVELAWDNLRQELQALAAEGFVAKTSPSTRLAATLRPGDAVSLGDSQKAMFAEVYSQEELDNLKVDAVTDTHAVVSGPLRSLGPVKLCHLAKK